MRRIVQLLGLALIAAPTYLHAQACFGVPQGSQGALGLGAGFTDVEKSFGAYGLTNSEFDIWLAGGVGVSTYDFEGVENDTDVSIALGHQVPALIDIASVCTTVGVEYSFDDVYRLLSVPVGLAFGRTLKFGTRGATSLTPYIEPRFIWSRVSWVDFPDNPTDTYFGGNAGATIGFRRLLVDGTVSKIFKEGMDFALGVRLGVVF